MFHFFFFSRIKPGCIKNNSNLIRYYAYLNIFLGFYLLKWGKCLTRSLRKVWKNVTLTCNILFPSKSQEVILKNLIHWLLLNFVSTNLFRKILWLDEKRLSVKISFCYKTAKDENILHKKLKVIYLHATDPLSEYWIYFIIVHNKINIDLCHVTRACTTSITTQINSQLLLISHEISYFSKFY